MGFAHPLQAKIASPVNTPGERGYFYLIIVSLAREALLKLIKMTTQPLFQRIKRGLMVMLVVGLACFQAMTSNPAQAEEQKYVDSEGKDLTAFVECLPEDYNQADLGSAIAKFGNDYLERVFRLKENTEDYKVSEQEKQLQACLQAKGIRPKS